MMPPLLSTPPSSPPTVVRINQPMLSSVRQDKRQAKEWFGKACDNGHQAGCEEYRKLNEEGY